MPDTFDTIILIGRPASGKSVLGTHLLELSADERRQRFHIGELGFIDDFPMLWTWFEEDQILTDKFDKPRLYTDDEGYLAHEYLWHLLIERIDLEHAKLFRDNPNYGVDHTTIVEFSRGMEHGGYAAAFPHFSDDLLRRSAVIYVNVSFEESQRRNRRRFNSERADSILEHGIPEDKLERLYRDDDWHEFSQGNPSFITVRSTQVPYIVFDNEDEVTSDASGHMEARFEEMLGELWGCYS